MKKKYFNFFICSIILILFDQIIKYFISSMSCSINIINNFLKFDYVKNDGVAFGIMGGSRIIIIVLTVLLLIYLLFDMKKYMNNKLQMLSYLLIISGAIGNLIDRIFLGYVRDFISFKLFNINMAIFNLADIYITFGVIIFIYIIVRDGINERNSSGK